MASIVKRKKKYSVVYTYTDENGNKRQKWETFDTNAEAKKRKLQVEYEQESGTFIPPSAKTVNDLLEEYMSIYGVNTWAMSTYESRKSLIANYIRPLIGDMKLEDVSPRIMDKYYRDLLIEELSSQRNEDYSDRADDYKAAKQALLEGLGLSHLFSGNRKLTPEEKELWLLFDRVYVTELLARDEFAKGAYMLGAEDRETMLR